MTQKRVVVLYAARKEAPWPVILENTYQTILSEGLAGGLDYYSEHIDVARFPEPAYQTALRDFLRHKYELRQPDLIIATSNTCIEFVERYGAEVFPGKAMVFNGGEAPIFLPNATGVSSKMDMKSTLDLALKLQPGVTQRFVVSEGVKRVFVVSGASDYDKYYEKVARKQFQEFEGRVELTYLVGLPMSDLQNTVANLPADSIIYYLSVVEDGAGNKFLPTEALDKISAVANAPIYCWSDVAIDHGIVGGSLMSIEIIAKQSAELALRVLHGEEPENIPVTEVQTNVNMFDWRQLRRWGISEKNLPPGSIVRFRVPSMWDQYKWRIIGLISLVIVQSVLIVGLIINRVRRKQADEAMRESEARFRVMADNAPVLIWVSGPDKLCTYFNRQWLEFTGRTMEHELGNGWAEGVHAGDYEHCLATYVSAFDSRRSFQMEYRLRRHDGEYRLVMDIGVPRFLSNGTFAGYIGSAIDITDRKRAEEALQQTQAELAHVARVLTTGELAATIAHEVNQPLTAMVANANAARRWLGNGKANLDEVRDAIDDIVLDAHRASEVVGRIRALLKKEGHRNEPLDINKVIHEVVAIVTNDLLRKKVSLGLDLAAGLPEVECDRIELQQVLLNLILNGVEAMVGELDRTRNLVLRTVRQDSSTVLVAVRDSGSGITPENLKRIFDAFYTTKPEGMGMGLAICRTIVEAHGGKLWAESNEATGATFRFTLPTLNERVL